jgi:hypothetical protein
MKEDHGLAVVVAAFHVVEMRPGPETHVRRPRRRTLVHASHRIIAPIAEQPAFKTTFRPCSQAGGKGLSSNLDMNIGNRP